MVACSHAERAVLSQDLDGSVIKRRTFVIGSHADGCVAERNHRGVGAVFGGSVNHGGIVAGFHADLQIGCVVEYIAVKVDDVDKLFVFFGTFVVFDLD